MTTPATQSKLETVTLTVAGTQHSDWTSYNIDSEFTTPADAWQVALGIPMTKTPPHVRPGARVSVCVSEQTVLEGRIDTVRTNTAKGQRTISLSGRDFTAALVDCSAPIFTMQETTLKSAVIALVQPLGITKVDVRTTGKFEKVSIDPGMTAWAALMRLCELNNRHAWFSPDGTLIIGGPDYSAPPVAELVLDPKGDTNVLSLTVDRSIARSYSEVTVLAQSHGGPKRMGMHNIKAKAQNEELVAQGIHRPLIVVDGDADSPGYAKKKAEKIMAEGKLASLTIRAEVRGHRAINPTGKGPLWEPGQRVRVVCPPDGIDSVYFLMGRTFLCSEKGQTTALTLKEDGVWVPQAKLLKPKTKK